MRFYSRMIVSYRTKITPFLTPSLKITSGEISAKEAAEERIWAGQTPRRTPRVPDAPKIKHDKMKQFYMVDMGQKMWYHHLMNSANPPRSRRKNLSRNEKSSDTTNENWLCRRLADTRDLKSLSEDRVWGCPRRRHWKSRNCSLIRMIVGLSFCSAFWKLWRDERNHFCIDDAVWTRLQEPFHAGP